MGMFKKKLNQKYKMLAVQVARDKFAAAGGNKVEFERLFRSDERLVGLDPTLILLLIKVAWMVFEYFRNRPVSGASVVGESDAEIYVNSLRYEE